jgi:hypothetical protein
VQYAQAGAVGKPWYNKSGQAIISHAGDTPALADAVIGGVARTSPQTDVASNLGHAVTLHSQALVGAPLKGGRFPNIMGKDVEGTITAASRSAALRSGRSLLPRRASGTRIRACTRWSTTSGTCGRWNIPAQTASSTMARHREGSTISRALSPIERGPLEAITGEP